MLENVDDKKQQLEKDRVKEDAANKAKPRCSICGKYTDKKTLPQCFGGHSAGGGSSGGSAEESASKGEDKELDDTLSKTTDRVAESSIVTIEQMIELSLGLQPQSGEIPFNAEIISELLLKNLLLIDSDRQLATLNIKLLCHPKDLSPEQRHQFKKFVDTISKELEEFKKENGITNNCKMIAQDKEGNIVSLRVTLPNATLYEKFIQQLARKNLLPKKNIEQKTTPFSIKPTPSANKNAAEDEEAHKERSSIRPKSPLDRLKRF